MCCLVIGGNGSSVRGSWVFMVTNVFAAALGGVRCYVWISYWVSRHLVHKEIFGGASACAWSTSETPHLRP